MNYLEDLNANSRRENITAAVITILTVIALITAAIV